MEEPEEWTAARKCLSPVLFNIYTNDHPLPMDCNRFIYVAGLCITTQHSDFQHVEHTLELALDEMAIYYSSNHLKPHPAKTQICWFHLRNSDAIRKLSVTWNGLELDHYPNPICLGVTLDNHRLFKGYHNTLLLCTGGDSPYAETLPATQIDVSKKMTRYTHSMANALPSTSFHPETASLTQQKHLTPQSKMLVPHCR